MPAVDAALRTAALDAHRQAVGGHLRPADLEAGRLIHPHRPVVVLHVHTVSREAGRVDDADPVVPDVGLARTRGRGPDLDAAIHGHVRGVRDMHPLAGVTAKGLHPQPAHNRGTGAEPDHWSTPHPCELLERSAVRVHRQALRKSLIRADADAEARRDDKRHTERGRSRRRRMERRRVIRDAIPDDPVGVHPDPERGDPGGFHGGVQRLTGQRASLADQCRRLRVHWRCRADTRHRQHRLRQLLDTVQLGVHAAHGRVHRDGHELRVRRREHLVIQVILVLVTDAGGGRGPCHRVLLLRVGSDVAPASAGCRQGRPPTGHPPPGEGWRCRPGRA